MLGPDISLLMETASSMLNVFFPIIGILLGFGVLVTVASMINTAIQTESDVWDIEVRESDAMPEAEAPAESGHYHRYKPVTMPEPRQEKCRFCGIRFHGSEVQCIHCGGAR